MRIRPGKGKSEPRDWQHVRPNQPVMRSLGAEKKRRLPWYAWACLALLLVGAVTGGATALLGRQGDTGPVAPPDAATVAVASSPAGAQVLLDGVMVGKTPAELWVAPGKRRLELRASGRIALAREFDAAPRSRLSFDERLWRSTAQLVSVGAPLPGTTIRRVDLLRDGHLALVVSEPSGMRQAWVTMPAGRVQRLGEELPASSVVSVSPTGRRLAYLGGGDADGPGLWGGGGYTQVWVAEAGHAPVRLAQVPKGAPERFIDLSWSSRDARVLAVSRVGEEGLDAAHTRLLSLPVGGGSARELARLPAEIVPDSYVWSPDGSGVAFLVSGEQGTSLCVVRVDGSLFKYLGDPGAGISSGLEELLVPPLSWSADGRKVVYSLPSREAREDGVERHTFYENGLDGRDSVVLAHVDADYPVAVERGLLLGISIPHDADNPKPVLTDVRGAGGFSSVIELPATGGVSARWDAARAQAILSTSDDMGTGVRQYWLARWTDR